jgi:signal transduction histidine kinase
MNYYSASSAILLKATNCYYAILDNNLHVQTANEKLKSLFFKKENDGHTLFLNLFAPGFQQQWKNVFNVLENSTESFQVIMAPAITEQGTLCIDWNISVLINDKDIIEGYEVLGVLSQKTQNKKVLPPANKSGITDAKGIEKKETEPIPASNVKPVKIIGALQDLTESTAHENMLQQLNISLEKRARELAESNADLERFAYVASHDLQEPLRMVSSFLQLLEKRYKDKLDQKAHEYIAYAVDGAERMKRLILDLLEYSRVNSSVVEKEDVDVNKVIDDLRLTYKNVLMDTNGTISNDQLPFVKGNKTQILQLFQNLIGNAFKYKSNKPPVVNISYKEDNDAYNFAVTDNGIGIDPKFFNKIFIIFQRLHNREQYLGTGIGLAICKKIIDKHSGKIWVSSAPGEGSTFYFTLPKFNKN